MTEWRQHRLNELRFHWSPAYTISYLPGPARDLWIAQRADDGATLTADTADGLRDLIAADYAARPVSREAAPGEPEN